MKMKHFMAASVLGIILLATQTQAQTDDTTNQPARRFTALLGYRYVPFDYSFAHDTHPDDSFLPGSGIRGSAGRTNLQNGHFGVVGVGYQARGKQVSFNLDGGVLLGGNRDRRKNANDSRPDANAAFIYSQANIGGFGAVGGAFHIKKAYLGGEGQAVAVFTQSGWDRFEKLQTQASSTKTLLSAGPKIGYEFDKRVSLEGTVQLGRATAFGLNLRYRL